MNAAGFASVCGAVTMLVAPTIIEPDRLTRTELAYTPQEIAAHRVAEESFLNTLAGLCGDWIAGSQVMRVQAELKSRNVQHATICEGREHPVPRPRSNSE